MNLNYLEWFYLGYRSELYETLSNLMTTTHQLFLSVTMCSPYLRWFSISKLDGHLCKHFLVLVSGGSPNILKCLH